MPVILVTLCAVAYHNSFTGPFIFDDVRSIRDNPTIRHLWPIWRCLHPPHQHGLTVEGRPLINLSLAINYALGGQKVWGYHALNLTVHLLAGLTLLGVVRRTLLQPRFLERFGAAANGLALTIAILWAVHPLQTESVTYVIQRAESIMGLFYLLTLYCFIRGAESHRPRLWYGLCTATCAMGMASKEVMASAPLIVLLYDRAFISGSFRKAWRQRWPLHLLLAGTWILLGYLMFFTGSFHNLVANTEARGITWWAYLLVEPGMILHYLRLSLWPHPLCLGYGWPVDAIWSGTLLPGLIIVSLLGAIVWACKTNSVWGVLGAWFFLILAPSSSFLPTDSPAYEHRMYLPLAAVVVSLVLGLYALAEGHRLSPVFWPRLNWSERTRARLRTVVVTALALVLAIVTAQRNAQYRTAESIWADVAAKFPENEMGHGNLALALLEEGRASESIPYFIKALRIAPNESDLQANLALALAASGDVDQALAQLHETLRRAPDCALAHAVLANLLMDRGELNAALEHYQAALAINTYDENAHFNLAQLLVRLGKRDEAIAQYRQVLQFAPDDPTVHYNLANLLAETGQDAEAVLHYAAAARLDPHKARSQINLGNLLLKQGRVADAIAAYKAALRADPDAFEAHNNLAIVLANRGDLVGATSHFREAARLKPELPEVHRALAEVLERQGLHEEAQHQLAEARKLMETSDTH
jgi:tetratricopeptide (TPR) repeat protein